MRRLVLVVLGALVLAGCNRAPRGDRLIPDSDTTVRPAPESETTPKNIATH